MSQSIGLSPELRDYVQRFGVREDPVLGRCREETARLPDARIKDVLASFPLRFLPQGCQK